MAAPPVRAAAAPDSPDGEAGGRAAWRQDSIRGRAHLAETSGIGRQVGVRRSIQNGILCPKNSFGSPANPLACKP